MTKRNRLSIEGAESLALEALSFLAEDPVRLGRFMSLTGIEAQDLRRAADAPETLVAVLDHILGDESLLLVFAAMKGLEPEALAPARALLAKSSDLETWP